MSTYLQHLTETARESRKLNSQEAKTSQPKQCACIAEGRAFSLSDVTDIQSQVDTARAEKRDFKAKVLLTMGLIDSHEQVLNYSDEEVLQYLATAAAA